MHESEWQARKQRINKRLLALTSALETRRRLEALFALVDEIKSSAKS